MTKMTLKQVRDELRATADHADSGYDKAWATRLADAIDAHLREREAAKAEASKAIVETSCKAAAMEWEGLVFPDAYSIEEADNLRKTMRAALKAVMPMLAGTRVPDGWQLVPVDPTLDMLCAGLGAYGQSLTLTGMYKAMLAEAPKPETEE